MPLMREKFYINPRTTFRRVLLQLRLKNNVARRTKVYGDAAVFSYVDLPHRDFRKDRWLEVVAEAIKDDWLGSIGVYFWKIRLTVDGTFKKEITINKWHENEQGQSIKNSIPSNIKSLIICSVGLVGQTCAQMLFIGAIFL